MRTPLTPLTALSPPQFVPRSGIARLSVASTGPLVAAGARVGPYVVGKALGSGHYAEVFEAVHHSTGDAVALKIGRNRRAKIAEEANQLRELGGLDGFARVQWSGAAAGGLEAFAMDRLGPSLQTALKKAENRQLPLAAWSSVGVEALGVLERLHEQAQLLHLDVKPSNFLLADAAAAPAAALAPGAALRLVDFGLARSYQQPWWSPQRGQHLPDGTRSGGLVGTVRYASVANHERRALGRRDDLESLAYMLVYLRTGSLPWRKVEAPTQPVRIKMTLIKKQRAADGVDLCKAMPPPFADFWAGIRALEHAERPDYAALRGLLEEAGREVG